MEKYRVSLLGKEYLIEIDGDKIFVDGEPYYAGIHFLNEDGLFMVEKDDGKRKFHITLQEDGSHLISTRGLQINAQIEPEKGRRKKPAAKIDAGKITAPIPGVVMGIHVAIGDQVKMNQVLVVLESMKMLMQFRAPFSGKIENIAVETGQKIEKGVLMLTMSESV